MAPPRRIDVVLDSVKRLLRIGATANLLNLLQKQHPADLAQIFRSLLDNERQAVFSILVERNGRLAMETVSEMGPEQGAQLLTGRSAEEIAKLLQEIPSDDAAALIDYLPEELSQRSARADAAARVGTGREPARIRRADRRPHHEPQRLRAERRPDGGRGDHGAAELARRRDGVLSLRRRCAPPPGGGHVAAPAAAGVARDAAQADHDARRSSASASTPTRKKWRGWSRRTTCWRSRSSTRRTSWSASSPSTTSSTSSRTRRPKTSIGWPACRGTSASATPPFEALRKRLPWLGVNLVTAFVAASVVALFEGTISRVTALAVFMPIVAGHGRQCRDADADGHRPRPGAGRAVLGQRAQGAAEGSDHRPRQRPDAGGGGGRRGLGHQGRPDARPAARHGDGLQHARRDRRPARWCRSG